MNERTQADLVPDSDANAALTEGALSEVAPLVSAEITTAFDPSTNPEVTAAADASVDAPRASDPPADETSMTQAEPIAARLDKSLAFLQPATRPDSMGRLGHFEVLQLLGKGGFGIVLKAMDDKLQRMVAIKVLGPQLAGNATARSRFVREARAAAAVNNKYVVGTYAVDEQPIPYLVMEYIAGQNLQDRIDENSAFAIEDIVRIGAEIAEGLAAAHKQGLIHRDIKPANILLEEARRDRLPTVAADTPSKPLTTNLRVRITDFGLARAVDDASLTRSGVIAGTPMFMSPEQARGENLDHRSDLFSLGSVLYTMCTGQPPFRANKTLGILKRVCDDEPRPIREINAAIPETLVAIINLLLVKDPSGRIQTAAEVATVLRQLLAQLDDPTIETPAALNPSNEPSRGFSVPENDARSSLERQRARRRKLALGLITAGMLLVASGSLLPLLVDFGPNGPGPGKDRPVLEPVNSEVALAQADQWLAERPPTSWTVLTTLEATSEGGATLTLQPDGSLLASGASPDTDVYRIVASTELDKITAIRLEAIPDPSLPKRGSGRQLDSGNFHLGEIQLEVVAEGAAEKAAVVPISTAFANYHQQGNPITLAFDGRRETCWNVYPRQTQAVEGLFQLHKPIARMGKETKLRITLDSGDGEGWKQIALGRFRLSATDEPDPVHATTLELLAQRADSWNRVAAVHVWRGDWTQALAALQHAEAEADGATGLTHLLLALVHEHHEQWAESEKDLHEAVAWCAARSRQDALIEAILAAAARRIEREPDNATPWLLRARWNDRLGRHAQAVADYAQHRKLAAAVAPQVEDLGLLQTLGQSLVHKDSTLDQAVVVYRQILELDAKNVAAYAQLGSALTRRNKLDEAAEVYRQLIAWNPKIAHAHVNLASNLFKQGQWEEANAALDQADALNPNDPWVRALQRILRGLQVAEAHLPALRKKEYQPKSTSERFDLIQICSIKKQHRLAAQLYADAFAAEPESAVTLGPLHRYAAARAAARALAEPDAAQLSEQERAALRRQAHAWLQTQLKWFTKKLFWRDLEGIADAADQLPLWQTESDLAGLRDPGELGKLPEDERKLWQGFWTQVQETLQAIDKSVTETKLFDSLTDKQNQKMRIIQLWADTSYIFDMESQCLDSYLILQDFKGENLMKNDDRSPGNLNARIVYTPRVSGVYRLVATAYQQRGTGLYLLRIRNLVGKTAE